MKAIIPFPQHEPGLLPAETACFLAVRSHAAKSLEQLQALTPRIMQWDADSRILDLRLCSAFWQYQARRQNQSLLECLQSELDELFAGQTYHAAFAETPWQAVLLLSLLEEMQIPGFTSKTSRFGSNIMRSLSWEIWWQCAATYAEQSRAHKKAEMSSFLQQKGAMELTMRRLGLKSPMQHQFLPSSQIKQRFGSLIAEIWEQTFAKAESSSLDAFPWRFMSFCENPRIQRHLDFSTNDWSTVEAYLADDLNRLCLLDSFKKGERILQLEWMIVLCNLQEIPVSILFRHPHSLHDESPYQRTALLQISYSFQKLWQKLQNHDELRIISWTLEVKEKIRPRMRQATLFHESRDDWHALMNLENMLLKPLEAYQLKEDWVPEDSFTISSGAQSPSRSSLRSLLQLGRTRPLFLYQTPQRILPQSSQTKTLWNFHERTMEKWWRRRGLTRNYYQFTRDAEMLWVFRDTYGEYFAQGVYA